MSHQLPISAADEALYDALARPSADGVQRALARGANPNARFHHLGSRFPDSALDMAIMAHEDHRAGCVRALIVSGADPNVATFGGSTTFHVACTLGDFEIVRLMNEAVVSPDPGFPSKIGVTPAMAAMGALDPDTLQMIQSHQEDRRRKDPNISPDGLWCWRIEGATNGLMFAAAHNRRGGLRWLLDHPEHGADGRDRQPGTLVASGSFHHGIEALDFEVRDNLGRTALWHAVKSSCIDNVDLLLARGARVDVQIQDGTSLMESLRGQGARPEFMALLQAHLDARRARRAVDSVLDQARGAPRLVSP